MGRPLPLTAQYQLTTFPQTLGTIAVCTAGNKPTALYTHMHNKHYVYRADGLARRPTGASGSTNQFLYKFRTSSSSWGPSAPLSYPWGRLAPSHWSCSEGYVWSRNKFRPKRESRQAKRRHPALRGLRHIIQVVWNGTPYRRVNSPQRFETWQCLQLQSQWTTWIMWPQTGSNVLKILLQFKSVTAHNYQCYNAITVTTSSYIYMFWSSLTHHKGTLQVVQSDRPVQWSLNVERPETLQGGIYHHHHHHLLFFDNNRAIHGQQHCYHHVTTVNQRLLLQLIGFWWWARGCPKHVELYLNDK